MERALIHIHYYVAKQPNMSTKQDAKALFSNVKDAVMGVHGAGEEVRGKLNGFIDHAFHDNKGEQKDRAVVQKGHEQMSALERRLDIEHEHGATFGQTHTQKTGAGSHFHSN